MDTANGRTRRIPEANKVPGLPYVYTDTGLELVVLDITHPLFETSIDENSLSDQRAQSATAAALIKAMSEAQRKMISAGSYIWGTHFSGNVPTSYLSGMATYMLKLGPGLLGGGEERKADLRATMGVSGIAARMRLRDLCRRQAGLLAPLLKTHPRAHLGQINVAGGAASDTFNTIRLVLRKDPSLLQDRRIEIHLLETDTVGPHFAEKGLAVLQGPEGYLGALDIRFQFHHGSWANTAAWEGILRDRSEDILLVSSEGGLFEYGLDDEILFVLEALAACPSVETIVAGSCLLDRETIDPTIPALAERSGSTLRFMGRAGLKALLESTPWSVEWVEETANPIYLVFSLRKR
jgi:hypothetical protein